MEPLMAAGHQIPPDAREIVLGAGLMRGAGLRLGRFGADPATSGRRMGVLRPKMGTI